MSLTASAQFSGFVIARLRPELAAWLRSTYQANPAISFPECRQLMDAWSVQPPAIPGVAPTAIQAEAAHVHGMISGIQSLSAVSRQRIHSTIEREDHTSAPYQPLRSLIGYFRFDTRRFASLSSVSTFINDLANATLIFDSVVREPSLTPPSPRVNWEDDTSPSGIPDASWQLHTEAIAYVGSQAKRGINCNSAKVWDSEYDGTGVGFVDIELGWHLAHPDLPVPQFPGTRAPFYNVSDPLAEGHGTSALGIVVGVDNAQGIVGIAPAATLRGVASYLKPGAPLSDPADITDAILESLEIMQPGDVLLLEVQTTGGGAFPGANNYLPVEVVDLWFDAIRLAVGSGMVVIEPAGNGHLVLGAKVGWDLDTVTSVSSARPLNRDAWGEGSRHLFDSGAIMVAACFADLRSDGQLYGLPDCNHGSRVDCYAWGEEVYTTSTVLGGYGSFGKTSAASAVIAGAAILVQQMWRTKFGTSASCADIRSLMSVFGTKVYGEAVVQPDLGEIADALAASPDVFVRDRVGDDGTVPGQFTSQSPDIIVRTTELADPQASLGEGSATEDTMPPSDAVAPDVPNYMYVRMRNRNPADATNVVARVYWAEAGTLIVPIDWHFIGESAPITVPGAPLGSPFGPLTVSSAIAWTPHSGANPPQMPAQHGCFIALLSCAADPPPPAIIANAGPGGSPTRWEDFLDFIGSSNNAAWRNFSLLNLTAKAATFAAAARFRINGADRSRRFDFQVLPNFPKGVTARFKFETSLARQFAQAMHRRGHAEYRDDEDVSFTMAHDDTVFVNGITLPAKSHYRCDVRLSIASHVEPQPLTVALRQLYRGVEVGRITFGIDVDAWKRIARS